jgi:hypothetical protein
MVAAADKAFGRGRTEQQEVGMNFDMKRFQRWDWGVLGAWVLSIIGLSIPWWHFKVGDILGGLDDALGGALGGLANVPDVSTNVSGWSAGVIGTGKATFSLILIALVWVVVKAFFRKGTPTPAWYKESWVIMGFGGLLTILGIVGCAKAPFGGFDAWSWRPGSIITLIAAVAMLVLGYFMYTDKTGAYDGAGKFALPAMGGQQPPAGYQPPPAGYQPPAAGKFCSNCGAGLAPEDAACRACGKPV